MPFCPQCHTEYRRGYTTCRDCGTTLVEISSGQPSTEEDETIHLVKLAEFLTPAEADMISELLQENGIDTLIRGQGDFLSVLHGTAVFVAESDLEEATKLYNAFFGEHAEELLEDETIGEEPTEH
jgi:hypothetical protein